MKKHILIAASLMLTHSQAMAQETAVFNSADTANDTVTDLEVAVQEDLDQAIRPRASNGYRKDGWRGAVSLSGSATSGNTDTVDLGIGARFGYRMDEWDHDVTLAYNYGEDTGTTSSNSGLLAYNASRYFDSRYYAFGDIRASYDEFGAYEKDYFAGVGLGYHAVDTKDVLWRVQAGPGYRYLEDSDGTTTDEIAGALSSKLWYAMSDTAILTNDTDILYSDSDTLVANDFGVNFALSGPLTMRTSLRSEYHSNPTAGNKSTDHTLGVSLIYSFN